MVCLWFDGAATLSSSVSTWSELKVATIPEGFRPKYDVCVPAVCDGNECMAKITTNGEAFIVARATAVQYNIVFSASYICAQDSVSPVILYDNESGATGTITLAETAANFKMLEVFYFNDLSGTNVYMSQRIYKPNGRYTTITSSGNVNNMIQHSYVSLLINGTAITQTNEACFNVSTSKTISDITTASSTRHNFIYCIVGYRQSFSIPYPRTKSQQLLDII